MPGTLRKIEALAQAVAPEWTSVRVVPRTVPAHVDRQMRGNVRHGRLLGNPLPNLFPENQTMLTQLASIQQTSIIVKQVIPGMEPGCLLSMGLRELVLVADVVEGERKIIATDNLLVSHEEGEQVDLFAEPVTVIGPTPLPILASDDTRNKILDIRSKYRIIAGDQLYILTDVTNIRSGIEYTVDIAEQLPDSGSLTTVRVTLDQAIPRDIAANDIVYLRAFPAYYSPRVNLPQHSRAPIPLGPFVVDYASGRYDDQPSVPETMDVHFYGGNGDLLDYPARMTKNQPFVNVPIHQSSLIFWDKLRGSINYRNDRFVLKCDSAGRAVLKTELVPAWPTGHSWTVKVTGRGGSGIAVRYSFHPNEYKTAGSAIEGLTIPMVFSLEDGEEPATKLEIVLSGPPGSEVEMGVWIPMSPAATKVQYTLSGRVVGNGIWQTGSLMVKPYFRVLADLELQLDSDDFDSGNLF